MSDLFWPGDGRAGELMTGRSLVRAIVRVELAWYAVLVEAGLAPTAELSEAELAELTDAELRDLAEAAEAGGNPVIPLVKRLRERTCATWLHRGLTSQDVFDTALILSLREVLDAVCTELVHQSDRLRTLVDEHRRSICAGRTLTQPAVPTTFGLIAADWLADLLDLRQQLAALRDALPAQVGGAGGTLSAIELLAPGQATTLAHAMAERLALRPSAPWHTRRRPVTRISDVLVTVADVYGRIANDVLLRVRPEVGELREAAGPGRGGSSTMPQKQNPVLAILLHRAALDAPMLGAALHLAAGAAVDQRSDGAWHAEWGPLRTLARHTMTAARQATELFEHLEVKVDAMAANAQAHRGELLAEAESLAESLAGVQAPADLTGYLGATDELIDDVLARAAALTAEAAR